MRLKIVLQRFGRSLEMRVLYQDGRRGISAVIMGHEFYRELTTTNSPELSHGTVYMRGARSEKNDIVCKRIFNSEDDADKAAKEIMALVAKVNGFKTYEIDVKPMFGNQYETEINSTGYDEYEVYSYVLVPVA